MTIDPNSISPDDVHVAKVIDFRPDGGLRIVQYRQGWWNDWTVKNMKP